MPTLATGRFDAPRRAGGFTLIELLTTLAIVAILGVGVALGVRSHPAHDAQRAAEGWLWQARWAAEHAIREAAVYAWEIDGTAARLWRRDDTLPDNPWLPVEGKPGRVPLSDALRVAMLTVEGQAQKVGAGETARIVFAGSRAPIFDLHLSGPAGRWRLNGDPLGRIELQQVANAS